LSKGFSIIISGYRVRAILHINWSSNLERNLLIKEKDWDLGESAAKGINKFIEISKALGDPCSYHPLQTEIWNDWSWLPWRFHFPNFSKLKSQHCFYFIFCSLCWQKLSHWNSCDLIFPELLSHNCVQKNSLSPVLSIKAGHTMISILFAVAKTSIRRVCRIMDQKKSFEYNHSNPRHWDIADLKFHLISSFSSNELDNVRKSHSKILRSYSSWVISGWLHLIGMSRLFKSTGRHRDIVGVKPVCISSLGPNEWN
jgi:hypothetical protein